MKNWIYIFLIGLMGCLVSSCQQSLDEEVQLPAHIAKARITFTIALNDATSRASRAGEWIGNETDTEATAGTSDENAINNIQIRAHYTNSYGLADMADVTIREFREMEAINQYLVEADMEAIANTETLACRLEVFANCTPENPTFKQEVQNIPMWGVKQITLYLDKDQATELPEPIYLLRAMAKVEVLVNDGVGELQSVTVNKYNKNGNVLPTGAASATATEQMNQESVFNPNATDSGENLSFTRGQNGGYYVYLPEYQNVGENGNKLTTAAQMTVTIGGKEYPLEFKMYSDDTPFDIVRNHYYQYTITGVAEDEVEVEMIMYQVMDWTEVDEMTLEFK